MFLLVLSLGGSLFCFCLFVFCWGGGKVGGAWGLRDEGAGRAVSKAIHKIVSAKCLRGQEQQRCSVGKLQTCCQVYSSLSQWILGKPIQ